MATLLAERLGRAPDDAGIRVYAGAVMGALIAAMMPAMEDPSIDFAADLDAALDLLEAGLRIG